MLNKREFLLFVAPIGAAGVSGEGPASPRRILFANSVAPPPSESTPPAPPAAQPSRAEVAAAILNAAQLLQQLVAL